MKVLVLFAVLAVAAAMPEHLFPRPDPSATGKHWGVLVAGSNTWDNYRHQADICHAYQILHKNGVPDSNIIVFMYDDIAYNSQNPFPGQIFNKPDGPDVYPGVIKDFVGEDVTPDNFVAVLTGDKAAVHVTEKNSTGRVLESGPNDNVFVYFADHGAPDLIAFPDGELMAKDLMKALDKMHHSRMFDKLVFYMEACESGSMFEKLPKNINIYATTAAGPDESSWGTYCDDPKIDTCLGDEYSVRWMEDADKEDLNTETLEAQFKLLLKEVKLSTPHKYGDMKFQTDDLIQYLGQTQAESNTIGWTSIGGGETAGIPSPEMKLALLQKRLMKTTNPIDRDFILQEIVNEAQTQRSIIRSVQTISTLVASDEAKAESYLKRPDALTVVEEDCYKTAVKAFSDRCFRLGQHEYALRLVYAFANMCNDGIAATSINAAMNLAC